MNRKQCLEIVEREKAVVIVRIPDPVLFEPIAEALYDGGIRIIEITMTVPGAIQLIRKAAEMLPEDMLLGVGSVLDGKTVEHAVEAGAQFVVSPVIKEEVIHTCAKLDKAVMPGAFSPTEIQYAWELGSDMIKVFPANVLGMEFFKAVKAPLPHLKLMPTGGVSLTNGGEWLRAGASAVGVGSSLVSGKDIQNRDFKTMKEKAKTLIQSLKS